MKYGDLIAGINRFGSGNADVCARFLGVDAKKICKNVVISPGWEPERSPRLGCAEPVSSGGIIGSFQVWRVTGGGTEFSYIKTGCGAPLVMDALLALGETACENIIFTSSVGALDKEMGIGDIVIPEYSVCGDGASRYIAPGKLDKDVFGEKAYPDAGLLKKLKLETEKACKENNIKWHMGRPFCADTLFAQYAHIDNITGMGCNALDMEIAAAFRAAKMMGKPLVAISNVSDNAVAGKTLVSGVTPAEREYRVAVRRDIIPEIIHNLIRG